MSLAPILYRQSPYGYPFIARIDQDDTETSDSLFRSEPDMIKYVLIC